jgi:hypothetical protein
MEINKYAFYNLTPERQERMLLGDTNEPFAVKCIKDIFHKPQTKLTRADAETAEALEEDIFI